MKAGPWPLRAWSVATTDAVYDARMSLPSISTLGIPKPRGRSTSGVGDCTDTGTEIAQWLFCRKKTTGAFVDAENTYASFTSPWLVAPSPK
ncbi:hypothetical protein QP157_01895 [Sphingomonas sp. LR61]